MTEVAKLAVLGAGSWGATLARTFASAGRNVHLYTRDDDKAEFINSHHLITKPITVDIPENVLASSDLASVVEGARILVFCCTSQSVRELATKVQEILSGLEQKFKPIIVSAVKGLELSTLYRMSEVILDVIPDIDVCCLSGPNLASEILRGLPAAAVIASSNQATASIIQKELSISKFRLYTNADMIGVEFGGTTKNVIAIAAGASDGLNLGANAKAALLTRGLAEMTRLSVAMGAKPLTLAGLAGIGDLLATCDGAASRNYRLGNLFVKGKALEDIFAEIGAAIEGVPTAKAICELSQRLNIDLPIATQVQAALSGKTSPEGAIMTLMSRPLASEQ
ncbi:MAG: NAD(P)-dependent glycerol-3-phosphate dehydrogenase [Candidatus Obscuribacterales bacterium]|nr:NAD(P)-dependent glycerol-3-phosphate dehydrogenase [Candidatus Obscuribacterales bacterium]